MHFEVHDDHRVVKKVVLNIMTVTATVHKEILGVYVSEVKVQILLQVLADLRKRGVKDLLIVCTDNLKGFSEVIESIYPDAEVQKCIVYQLRNTLLYTQARIKKK